MTSDRDQRTTELLEELLELNPELLEDRRPFLSRHAFVLTVVLLFVAFAIPTAVGFKAIQDGNQERTVRRAVQAEVNRYVCDQNNRQDRLLASLLAVSLQGAAHRHLTSAQLKSVRIFRRALRELRSETPCHAIAEAFLEARDTNDLQAIRRLLYRVAKREPPPPKIGLGPGKPATHPK